MMDTARGWRSMNRAPKHQVRERPGAPWPRTRTAALKVITNLLVAAAAFGLIPDSVGQLQAQSSVPRITLAGNGLVSFNINGITSTTGASSNTDVGTVNDFSDTFVMLRLDQQLYNEDRVGVIVGFLFPDARSDLGQVFYHRVQVFYDAKNFRGTLGRSRLGNFVLEFPTLREEDLLDYGFVLNPFVNAEDSEFSRYGNIARFRVYQFDTRLILEGQATNLAVTDDSGRRVDDFDINNVSARVMYRLPSAVRFRSIVREAGIGWFANNIDEQTRNWIHSVVGGAAFNLVRNPLNNIAFQTQVVYNGGAGILGARSTGDLAAPRVRARSKSVALLASFRLLRRPYQLQRFQAAITAGYKRFPDVDASEYVFIPNVFFRLGQGVDLGVQYQYRRFNDAFAVALGVRREQSVKFTLNFQFQAMFNNYFGERDDILNLEHGYIR